MDNLTHLEFFEDLDNPEACIETFPCTHVCILTFQGVVETKDLDGVTIVECLRQLGKPIPPHFREYV